MAKQTVNFISFNQFVEAVNKKELKNIDYVQEEAFNKGGYAIIGQKQLSVGGYNDRKILAQELLQKDANNVIDSNPEEYVNPFKPKKSEWIHSISWYNGIMTIQFEPLTTNHKPPVILIEVPKIFFLEFVNAESKGKFYLQYIALYRWQSNKISNAPLSQPEKYGKQKYKTLFTENDKGIINTNRPKKSLVKNQNSFFKAIDPDSIEAYEQSKKRKLFDFVVDSKIKYNNLWKEAISKPNYLENYIKDRFKGYAKKLINKGLLDKASKKVLGFNLRTFVNSTKTIKSAQEAKNLYTRIERKINARLALKPRGKTQVGRAVRTGAKFFAIGSNIKNKAKKAKETIDKLKDPKKEIVRYINKSINLYFKEFKSELKEKYLPRRINRRRVRKEGDNVIRKEVRQFYITKSGKKVATNPLNFDISF